MTLAGAFGAAIWLGVLGGAKGGLSTGGGAATTGMGGGVGAVSTTTGACAMALARPLTTLALGPGEPALTGGGGSIEYELVTTGTRVTRLGLRISRVVRRVAPPRITRRVPAADERVATERLPFA